MGAWCAYRTSEQKPFRVPISRPLGTQGLIIIYKKGCLMGAYWVPNGCLMGAEWAPNGCLMGA